MTSRAGCQPVTSSTQTRAGSIAIEQWDTRTSGFTRSDAMHILDVLSTNRTTFSFEFFPPKTDKASKELFANIAKLQPLRPSFISVTYGAGGTTRERTHDLIVRIQTETSLTAVSHLTCVCHSRAELEAILDRYAVSGMENIMALRGDPPRDHPDYDRSGDAFLYAADLVHFIKDHPRTPDPRGFGVGVAGFPEGHPECPNRLKEMEYLKRKVDAGADYICTQLFFDNGDFYDFRDRCELSGINVPIIAGIMPGLTHHNSETGSYGKFHILSKPRLLLFSFATFR